MLKVTKAESERFTKMCMSKTKRIATCDNIPTIPSGGVGRRVQSYTGYTVRYSLKI